MKLRIKGNSIRLRLLQSEVARLVGHGEIIEETALGANTLRYSIRMTRKTDEIGTRFENGEIEIAIPEMMARGWADGDSVSLEAEQGGLSILVEKDFVCLDRPHDPDREDAYPNPSAACTTN